MIEQDSRQQPVEEQREPSQFEVASMIADQLGETEFRPKACIVQIVRALGRSQSKALLAKTLEIEASGGMMLPDNSRRRTAGGTFFYLVYTTGQPKEGRHLPPRYKTTGKTKKPAEKVEKPD